jgi:serine protease Do
MARRISFTTLCITIGFLAGMVLTGRMRTAEESSAAEQTPPAAQSAAPRPAVAAPAAVLPDLTSVAQRVVGSVTNISSTQIVRSQRSPFENDPFFRYFFGDDDAFNNRERRAQSLGSGVIVSADGYLLTNNHVIGDVNAQVSVVLGDKREMPARIVGVDEWTDIAVLKVDARNLPVLPWGDSSKLKVAEWVLAIGNPFQLNQTVTLGIVSATGRSLEGRLATYEDFIQTDAAINPGNSGGALINARGELVGINTAIYSESGGYQGIGFAVPSNLAQHVMDDLIKFGEVRRGTIPGIKVQPMTTQIAQQLGAPNARGALVYSVDRRSDAYRSGLLPGDIIVGFNGSTIEDTSQFIRLLSDAPIGTTVTLGLLRQGKPSTVKVAVTQATGARPTNRRH